LDTGLFISLLNPAITLTLAAAFLVLFFYRRDRLHLALVVAAYIGSTSGFLLQNFTLPVGLTATKVLSNVAFTLAVISLSAAILLRYSRPVPWLGIGLSALGGFSGFCWFMFAQPDLTWRILSISFAFGAISLMVALELKAMPNKGRIETLLVLLAFLSAANFLARPLIVIAIEGPYASGVDFQTSLYWTTALLTHAVMSLMIALCLFTAEAVDLMRTLRSESITDSLSGLLNRRGFETRASAMLGMCQGAGLPASLIIADLDRFKALNDRHGHAAGDRVIAEFAARLRAAAGTRAVAGRLGGEEFAVLLPMADAAAARLFTEAVRQVFSGDSIAGLPREVRVTASFGIALCAGKESLSELMRRADEALYHAKRGGRDSVRVSYQRPPEPPVLANAVAAA
jgi:diguanylate cyclase (GGDEF)-like protein